MANIFRTVGELDFSEALFNLLHDPTYVLSFGQEFILAACRSLFTILIEVTYICAPTHVCLDSDSLFPPIDPVTLIGLSILKCVNPQAIKFILIEMAFIALTCTAVLMNFTFPKTMVYFETSFEMTYVSSSICPLIHSQPIKSA